MNHIYFYPNKVKINNTILELTSIIIQLIKIRLIHQRRCKDYAIF